MCIAGVGKGEARGEAGAGARGGMLGFSRFNLLRKEEEEKEEEEGRRQECLSKARRVSFSKGRVGGERPTVFLPTGKSHNRGFYMLLCCGGAERWLILLLSCSRLRSL